MKLFFPAQGSYFAVLTVQSVFVSCESRFFLRARDRPPKFYERSETTSVSPISSFGNSERLLNSFLLALVPWYRQSRVGSLCVNPVSIELVRGGYVVHWKRQSWSAERKWLL